MTGTGTVTRLLDSRKAEVRIRRETACGHDCKSCGVCAMPPAMMVEARNHIQAQPGDVVLVESRSAELLKLAAVVYLLPVLLFLSGWSLNPWLGAAGAAAGLGAAYLANRRLHKRGGVPVHIVKILEDGEC